jgi:hypothetical protein
MRGFYVRAPFHLIGLLDARIQWIADILGSLGDTDDQDSRRVKAIAVLANPHQAVELIEAFREWREGATDASEKPEVDWKDLLPAVTLFVHLYAGAEETGIARVEGQGPVTEAWLRRHLGPHARFTIRPVIDIPGQAPVDAYEIPDRHRQAVHLMTPADTFPFGSCTSRSQQIDHTVAYEHAPDGPAGQSRVGNYGPMTQHHHRIKTHGGWQVQQPFPGIYVWRDPHGATYLVDHTGTRRLPTEVEPSPAEVGLSGALFELVA